MSKDKIDIKDVTPKEINPKTHKGSDDRFNPSNRIYVRSVKGVFQKLRLKMGWFFILLFVMTPWIPYGDRQAILIDIGKQQFHFFGTTLWPQDLPLLAVILMVAAFGLFFITTFMGRVWCGYLCPQTVWTFIYIWFEEKFEGSANKRHKQDQQPITRNLLARKTLKHLCWFAVALLTGLTFVGYFVPVNALFLEFFTFSSTFWIVFWVLFFSFCTYGNAGWMRSIMCIHMCPYARFQSAMFDQDTFIVGYDRRRGETRGPRPKHQDPKEQKLGDCIDCNLCVQVCPTGIDIRDGLQYECINCGACIDACNETMDQMKYDRGLINYTTEHKLDGHNTNVMRPKLIGYCIAMVGMFWLFFSLFSAVQPMGLDVLRDRNQLYKTNNEGLTENTYILKILNKTQHSETYSLSVTGFNDIMWYGKQRVTLQAGEIYTLPVSLAIEPDELKQPIANITFILKRHSGNDKKEIKTESRFISTL